MKSAEKEKMCISCEGRIPVSSQVCPYCAAHQMQSAMQNSFQTPIFQEQSLEDSLTSLYTPPYQGKHPQFDTVAAARAESDADGQEELPLYKEVTERAQLNPLIGATAPEEEERRRSGLFSMTLLFTGMHLAIIGLMQLFFSKNGVLRLQWDANHWFFYCLASSPLLYFGVKALKQLRD